MFDYSVTFATLNCLDYTKLCVASLISSGVDAHRIVAVDNASTDGTPEYLNNLGLGSVILNRQNLSCGAAWNQGILANQSEWTIVMNNDIIVAPDFVQRLINFAIRNNLKLVSPARIDGEIDYDFNTFANKTQEITANAIRWGSSNAICMCIHWSLFSDIGFFRANPTLLGFEDGLFYNEVRKHNILHATTGSVWIHHFGSVTQDLLKLDLGLKSEENLINLSDRKLYGQTWIERKFYRHKIVKARIAWRKSEMKDFGISLQGLRINNNFVWF